MVHSPTVTRFLQRHAQSLHTVELSIGDIKEPADSLLTDSSSRRIPCPGLELSLPMLKKFTAPFPYWELLDPQGSPMLEDAAVLNTPMLPDDALHLLRHYRRIDRLRFQLPNKVKETKRYLRIVGAQWAIRQLVLQYSGCSDGDSETVSFSSVLILSPVID